MKRLWEEFGDDEDEEDHAPAKKGQASLLITQGQGKDEEEKGKGKELKVVVSNLAKKRRTKVTPKRQKTIVEKPPKVQPTTRVHTGASTTQVTTPKLKILAKG